ncbi:hypothetical protein JQ625_29800 [Bradyrhizobium diazoefficiens]|nr:hypothetical protein [Bradyrhizobium diazoefficiens]MBR0779038.1 hypothetical protein [Bradyrhizobium diazoefficiens]
MIYILITACLVTLGSYCYWIGFQNGRDEGIKQAGELWPIDIGVQDNTVRRQ